ALDAVGIRAEAVAPTDAMSGKPITRFDLTKFTDPPYRFCHRADLITILMDACRASGVTIHLSSALEAADIFSDIVVAADGIKSTARPALNGSAEPFFTGQVAWRALIPAENADPVARIWMAPRGHVVTYPVRGGRLNIVAVQERQQWAAEGWNHADDPDNLRYVFRHTAWELRSLLEKVEEVRLWGLFRHEVAEVWHSGAMALVGDAAHPTLPFLAQGANLAIEDALVLARCCDARGSVLAGLAAYEGARKGRVTRAIAAANANARNYHLSGVPRRVAHLGLKTFGILAPNAFLGRMDWLYGHDVTAEPLD
ncbi:MAG: FAD-dependent monooxygenase, partial [Pseudomonadota bacterium]